jgi:3-oxoacyl-[acyl-carrier protein] reductase
MSLKGKNVIVTGGSRGIGKAIVELLVSKGANVIFTYYKEEALAKELESFSCQHSACAKAYKLNIMQYDKVLEFAGTIAKQYKHIDVIINNAGIRKDKSLLYMDKSDWEDVINTNLTGVFNMTKSLMPYLLKERKGRIINISSVSGINGLPGQTNYSSSKAGIIGFTKALAKEVASFGLSINAVAPGPVETDMLDGLSDTVKKNLIQNVPIKRMCTPKEIAMMVHVLADDELTPQYLTGQVISIDGGMGL